MHCACPYCRTFHGAFPLYASSPPYKPPLPEAENNFFTNPRRLLLLILLVIVLFWFIAGVRF